MKKVIYSIAIAMALTCGSELSAKVRFTDTVARNYRIASPINNYFVLDGSFIGHVSIGPDSLFFDMLTGSIRKSENYKEEWKHINVVNIKIGIGVSMSNGSWELVSLSNPLPVNAVIDPSTETKFAPFHFAISLNNVTLKGSWLAFSIALGENNIVNAFTYVHGSTKLFAEPVNLETWPRPVPSTKNILARNYTIASSDNNPFGIDAKFTGDISMDNDSLYFNVYSCTLRQNLRFVDRGSDIFVSGIRLDISGNELPNWQIQEYGRFIKMNKNIGVFDDVDIPPGRFAVSRKKVKDLGQCWPTFTVVVTSDTGPSGAMYYHGKRNVFQAQ